MQHRNYFQLMVHIYDHVQLLTEGPPWDLDWGPLQCP